MDNETLNDVEITAIASRLRTDFIDHPEGLQKATFLLSSKREPVWSLQTEAQIINPTTDGQNMTEVTLNIDSTIEPDFEKIVRLGLSLRGLVTDNQHHFLPPEGTGTATWLVLERRGNTDDCDWLLRLRTADRQTKEEQRERIQPLADSVIQDRMGGYIVSHDKFK